MSVLLARVGAESYAIPLDHLDEIVEVGPGQVYHVHGHSTIEIRDRIISLVALDQLLRDCGQGGHRNPGPDPRPTSVDGRQTVVVVSNGEATLGLIVDELLGMQEAVLKSLEKNFRPVPGLSGASILGDGRVSLILDIDALIDRVALDPAGSSAEPSVLVRRKSDVPGKRHRNHGPHAGEHSTRGTPSRRGPERCAHGHPGARRRGGVAGALEVAGPARPVDGQRGG